MICWKCLNKMGHYGSVDGEGSLITECRCCDCDVIESRLARADRFMALVNSVECGLHSYDTREEPFVHYARERAEKVLRDIESAVESGALFGEGGEKP